MRKIPKWKERIFQKTCQRRKYNNVVDGRSKLSEEALAHMAHKPYSTGEALREKKDTNYRPNCGSHNRGEEE